MGFMVFLLALFYVRRCYMWYILQLFVCLFVILKILQHCNKIDLKNIIEFVMPNQSLLQFAMNMDNKDSSNILLNNNSNNKVVLDIMMEICTTMATSLQFDVGD